MNSETRILNCLNDIDDTYIEQAAPVKRASKKPVWIRWGAAAACLCLIALGAVTLFKFGVAQPAVQNNTVIVAAFGGDSSCYTSPKPGEYFCFTEVSDARNAYSANPGARYLLAFDMMSKDGIATEAELNAEYARLSALGYSFYRVPVWHYTTNGEKVTTDRILGLYTEAQLEDFPASANYGYAFHFIVNGDSSAVDTAALGEPMEAAAFQH